MHCGSGGDALNGDSQLARFVDEVAGDAGTGEGDETLGQQVQEVVVAAERCGPSVGGPVRLTDDLVDAVALGPACGDLLYTGAAAMDQDDVVVLGLGLVQHGGDVVRITDLLAARHRDQRSLWQVRACLAVLAGALEVAGIDGRRGEHAGLADVRSGAGPPHLTGLDAVGLGGGIAEFLEGIAAVTEVLRPCGDLLKLIGPDL